MKKPQTLSITEAANLIQSGNRIVLGHACLTPTCLMEELYRQRERLHNVTIFHMIYLGGELLHLRPECEGHFRGRIPFILGPDARAAVQESRADYLPIHFSYVPSLFTPGAPYETPDWTLLQVSPADENGYYSCSLSSDFSLPAAKASKGVIAVVNPQLPYIGGDNLLHETEITALVHHSSTPFTVPASKTEEVDEAIANRCAELIPDRATIQIGIGAIPDAVLGKLTNHKDLGVHTELFSDSVMHLHKQGVITGKYKRTHPNKVVGAFVMGSSELYQYIHKNPEFELYPVHYANNPHVIGKEDNFVSINSCIEIDLYGQVCAEKIHGKMFSGSGGQLDYLRGARYSNGGKSILALRSTTKGDTISRIRPNLHPQACVTSPRNDVDYIVTEYGVARMFGATEMERAKQLINIAHPNFREELEREAHSRWNLGKVF